MSAVSTASGPTSTKRVTPCASQRADAVGEADRLADVPDPVLRGRELVAGEVRRSRLETTGSGGAVKVRPCADRAELVEHRLHQRRVEGVADRSAASSCGPARASCASSAATASAGPETTTDARAVDRGDAAGRRGAAADLAPRWPGRRPSRRRRAAPASAARGRRPARTRRPARARRRRARPRARRSSGRPGRRAARPRTPSSRYSATSTANSAGWVYSVWFSSVGRRPNITSAAAGRGASSSQHLVERCGEDRVRARSSSRAHAGALRALAGEQERQPPVRPRDPAAAAAVDAASVAEHGRRGARDCAGAGRWPAATATSASGSVGVGRQPARAAARPGRAGRPRSCAESTSGSGGSPGATGCGLGRRRLLEDHVGVGAADAERGDAGAARRARRAATAAARSAARTSPADQSTCGDGSSTCRVARQHAVPHRHAPS